VPLFPKAAEISLYFNTAVTTKSEVTTLLFENVVMEIPLTLILPVVVYGVLNIVFYSKGSQCLICGGQIGTGTGFSSRTSVLFLLVFFYRCSTFIPISITDGIHP